MGPTEQPLPQNITNYFKCSWLPSRTCKLPLVNTKDTTYWSKWTWRKQTRYWCFTPMASYHSSARRTRNQQSYSAVNLASFNDDWPDKNILTGAIEVNDFLSRVKAPNLWWARSQTWGENPILSPYLSIHRVAYLSMLIKVCLVTPLLPQINVNTKFTTCQPEEHKRLECSIYIRIPPLQGSGISMDEGQKHCKSQGISTAKQYLPDPTVHCTHI